MKAKPAAANEYQLKPKNKDKFKAAKAKEIIQEVLNAKLKNQSYQDIANITKDIADQIKYKLKECQFLRYKYIVHVFIGQ